MDNASKLQEIRDSINYIRSPGVVAGDGAAETRVPKANVDSSESITFLLSEVDRLTDINKQLVSQNQELISEIENVKADFDGDRR